MSGDAANFTNSKDEMHVVAAALAHEENRKQFAVTLKPEDFTVAECKVMAWGILRAVNEGRVPDHRTFHTLIDDCPFGKEFGGHKMIQTLVASCPRPLEDMKALCERVALIGLKDRAFQSCVKASEIAADPTRSIDDIRKALDSAGRTLDGFKRNGTQGFRTPAEINVDYYETLKKRMEGRGFFPTGLAPLDAALTEGFLPGRMTLIAGRPSQGKTTFVVNLLHRCSSLNIGSVAMFSNEAPDIAVWDKMNAISTGIPLVRLLKQSHELSVEEKQLLFGAMRHRETLRLEINAEKTFSVGEMESTIASRYRAGRKFDVVFIDLFSRAGEFKDTETREGHAPTVILDNLVRVQQIADRYQFHAVLCVQMGRYESEGRSLSKTGKGRMMRPPESRIYGADAYQQVCDNIWLLHRCFHYNPVQYPENILEVWIRKQRYGEVTMRCFAMEETTGRIQPTDRFPTDFSDLERVRYGYKIEAPSFQRR